MPDQQEPPIIDPVQEARVIEAWKEYSGYSRPAPFVSRDHEVSFEAFSQGFKRGQQGERDRVAALIEAAVMEACKRGTSQSFDEGVHAVQFALAAAMREVKRD